MTAALLFFDGTNESVIPFGTEGLVFPERILAVTAFEERYFQLAFSALGNAAIEYTVGGTTYTLPVAVQLPEYGFYSTGAGGAENYLSMINPRTYEGNTVWLVKLGNGMTEDEANALRIVKQVFNGPGEPTVTELRAVRYDAGSKAIEITFDAPAGGGYNISVMDNDGRYLARTRVEYQEIQIDGTSIFLNDKQYIIGFGWNSNEDGALTVNEGNWRYGNSSAETFDVYHPYRQLRILSGERKVDQGTGGVYYEELKTDIFHVQVTGMKLTLVDGEDKVFSWSDSSYLDQLDETVNHFTTTDPDPYREDDTPVSNSAILYFKPGHNATVLLEAEITYELGGEKKTGTVSIPAWSKKIENVVWDRSQMNGTDTTAALQAFLAQQDVGKADVNYELILDNVTYDGLTLPWAFAEIGASSLQINGSKNTRIKGQLDLGGGTVNVMTHVFFESTGVRSGTAITNGSLLNLYQCTFKGYDVAVDSAVGFITLTQDNLFVDNRVGVRVKIDRLMYVGQNRNGWDSNVFIQNDIGVQIVSLNEFINPYYLRLTGSNMISNNTDVSLELASGEVFFYRNWYGRFVEAPADREALYAKVDQLVTARTLDEIEAVITSRSAVITVPNTPSAKLIVNPRHEKPLAFFERLYWPVAGERGCASYDNPLIIDPIYPVRILNDEAAELLIDAKVFESDDAITIDVTDRSGETLAAWDFGGNA